MPQGALGGRKMTNTQLKSSEELDETKSVQLVGGTEEGLQRCPVISRLLINHSASLFMQKQRDLSYMDPCTHASRNNHRDISTGEQCVPQTASIFYTYCRALLSAYGWVNESSKPGFMTQSYIHVLGVEGSIVVERKSLRSEDQIWIVRLAMGSSSLEGCLWGPLQPSDTLRSNHKGTGQASLIIIIV